MPAHSKLTPDVEAKMLAAASTAVSFDAIAAAGGVPTRTLYRWLARGRKATSGKYKDFALSFDRARAQLQITLAAVWRKAAQKDWRAARAFLRARFPETWSDHKKLDVTAQVKHSLPP